MTGPRIFTVEQVNELVSELETVLQRVDQIREKIQTVKIRVNALEMIWGDAVQQDDCPDYQEFKHYMDEMKSLEEKFNAELAKIGEMGGMVKGVDPALVDFYGVRDGFLVFLCWRRGEKHVEHFHDLETGFAGRQPI